MDYKWEKDKLKKKLLIMLVSTVIVMVILCVIGKVSIGWGLMTGIGISLVFYVPVRIREKFKTGVLLTVVIAIAYLYLYIELANRIGAFSGLLLLLPVADIGYSIYKMASYKKK